MSEKCDCDGAYPQTVFRCREHGWMMCGIDGSTFPTTSPEETMRRIRQMANRDDFPERVVLGVGLPDTVSVRDAGEYVRLTGLCDSDCKLIHTGPPHRLVLRDCPRYRLVLERVRDE